MLRAATHSSSCDAITTDTFALSLPATASVLEVDDDDDVDDEDELDDATGAWCKSTDLDDDDVVGPGDDDDHLDDVDDENSGMERYTSSKYIARS